MFEVTFEQDGDRTMVSYGGKRHWVDCLVPDAKTIGLKLKVIEPYMGQLRLTTNLAEAIRQVESVLLTSNNHIAKARGQIEDAGGETATLSDLDVAIMDVYVREWLAEQAREIDDPFSPENGSARLSRKHVLVPAPNLADLFEGYVGEDANEDGTGDIAGRLN